MKISRKTQGNLNFCRKTWKSEGECETFDIVAIIDIMYSTEFFSVNLLRENLEEALEISGKTQGKLREFSVLKMWSPVWGHSKSCV